MRYRRAFLAASILLVAVGCAGLRARSLATGIASNPDGASSSAGARAEASGDAGTSATATYESTRLERLRGLQRSLEYTAGGALLATATLGMLVFGNQPTSFDDGRCISGDPHFGDYGCSSLSTVHGILGVTAAITYTSAGTMKLALPDSPEGAPNSAFEGFLTPAHVVGMVLTPAVGIVGREPGFLGFDSGPDARAPRAIRTVHASIAVTTVALYAASFFVD